MMANVLIKALSSTHKHEIFVRMTGIKDQKDLLVSIERKKNICQQLQTNLKYNKIYGYTVNIT